MMKKNDKLTIDLLIMNQRESCEYHKTFHSEKQIFRSIREGQKDKMLVSLYDFSKTGVFGKVALTSEIRNTKNLHIAAITLATRAAIEGGLFPEVAYTLSDMYIRKLEDINALEELECFLEPVFIDFVERVEQAKRLNLTKSIHCCQEYIFNHLYEELSLSVLAEHVHMNPSYLSAKFKQETGQTVTEYIRETRIEEAKKLIHNSEYSIAEIYTLLNFHDQSYFTKVFKKYTGMTPKQYKDRLIYT